MCPFGNELKIGQNHFNICKIKPLNKNWIEFTANEVSGYNINVYVSVNSLNLEENSPIHDWIAAEFLVERLKLLNLIYKVKNYINYNYK